MCRGNIIDKIVLGNCISKCILIERCLSLHCDFFASLFFFTDDMLDDTVRVIK
jgi:hypothetical protein